MMRAAFRSPYSCRLGAEKEIAAEQRFSVLTRLIVAAAPAVSAAPRAAPHGPRRQASMAAVNKRFK
jgi:hypothetical protein